MKFGLEPVGNRSVYKRVGINDPAPAKPYASPSTAEICDRLMKQHEGNRIWALVKETAEGTNAPAVAQGEYQAPEGDAA